MKYILLSDKNNEYLVCEFKHHLDCHKDGDFFPLYTFEADDYEDAIKKADDWVGSEKA